ncbi:hypothetical protein PG993_004000 [Apiospora rasikravindrae]|uniref:Uncharacterized protein n=1 Tax=Apiospora rasikravindrae TaxID=990691 RepID=A0ABR1TBK8_9PEZI
MYSKFNRDAGRRNSDTFSTASTAAMPMPNESTDKPRATGSDTSTKKEPGRTSPMEKGIEAAHCDNPNVPKSFIPPANVLSTIPEEPLVGPQLQHKPLTRPAETKAQGFWNTASNTDLTLHLELEVVEDLETIFEEFSRFCMLGCFTACKQFVKDNLGEHLHLPYVRCHLAEMMMRQGDFTSLVDLGYQTSPQKPANEDERLLEDYLGLMTLLAENHDPKTGRFTYHGIMSRSFDGLSRRPQSEYLGSTKFWRDFYSTMLRQGRVWDISGPLLAMGLVNGITPVISNIFDGATLSEGIGKLMAQWMETVPPNDVLTISALLDFLMCLLTEFFYWDISFESNIEYIIGRSTPLALALVQNNQDFLKTRPYLRWVLATARHAHEKASSDVDSFVQYLKRQGGSTFYSDRRSLPQYIPVEQENPEWQLPDAAPQFKDPIRLVLRIARDLGDYITEVMALQQLILFSKTPAREFAELCELQRSTGDLVGYVNTLLSRYLVSNTDEARHQLQEALSDEILVEGVSDVMEEDLVWKACELIRSLKTSKLKARLPHRIARGFTNGISPVILSAENTSFERQGGLRKRPMVDITTGDAPTPNRVRFLLSKKTSKSPTWVSVDTNSSTNSSEIFFSSGEDDPAWSESGDSTGFRQEATSAQSEIRKREAHGRMSDWPSVNEEVSFHSETENDSGSAVSNPPDRSKTRREAVARQYPQARTIRLASPYIDETEKSGPKASENARLHGIHALAAQARPQNYKHISYNEQMSDGEQGVARIPTNTQFRRLIRTRGL